MAAYGQFCPVAKASEILAERWTPLIVRELLLGSRRFSELEWGLPGIPRALLVRRLRLLEKVGVLVRQTSDKGRTTEYHLTQAGEELMDVVLRLGEWGQRWANDEVAKDEIKPALLMWDMRRRIKIDLLPNRRVVVEVDFLGVQPGKYWLVLSPRDDIAVCLIHPGFDVDLRVLADAMAMHQIWLGRLSFAEALSRELVVLDGPADLVKAFPSWLSLSVFAHIAPARQIAAIIG
jgi:DNA-binding HxlR family transcriptional regulator